MKCYKYNCNYNDYKDLENKRKLIIRNQEEEFNLLNKHIKIINKLNEKIIKKVIGIEYIPTERYNSNLDILCSGGYYTNTFTVNQNQLRKDYKVKNNKLIILTLA